MPSTGHQAMPSSLWIRSKGGVGHGADFCTRLILVRILFSKSGHRSTSCRWLSLWLLLVTVQLQVQNRSLPTYLTLPCRARCRSSLHRHPVSHVLAFVITVSVYSIVLAFDTLCSCFLHIFRVCSSIHHIIFVDSGNHIMTRPQESIPPAANILGTIGTV